MAFLAPLAPIFTAVSAVTSAVGFVQQGLSASAAGKANQRAMNQAAAIRAQQGALNAQQTRREGARLLGEQRLAIAGSGVDVGIGSPLELMAESAREIEWRAELAKWEAETDATALRNRGAFSAWEGDIRRSTAYGSAVGALFKGGSALGDYFRSPSADPLSTKAVDVNDLGSKKWEIA